MSRNIGDLHYTLDLLLGPARRAIGQLKSDLDKLRAEAEKPIAVNLGGRVGGSGPNVTGTSNGNVTQQAQQYVQQVRDTMQAEGNLHQQRQRQSREALPFSSTSNKSTGFNDLYRSNPAFRAAIDAQRGGGATPAVPMASRFVGGSPAPSPPPPFTNPTNTNPGAVGPPMANGHFVNNPAGTPNPAALNANNPNVNPNFIGPPMANGQVVANPAGTQPGALRRLLTSDIGGMRGFRYTVGGLVAGVIAEEMNSEENYVKALRLAGNDPGAAAQAMIRHRSEIYGSVPLVGGMLHAADNGIRGRLGGDTEQRIEADTEMANREKDFNAFRADTGHRSNLVRQSTSVMRLGSSAPAMRQVMQSLNRRSNAEYAFNEETEVGLGKLVKTQKNPEQAMDSSWLAMRLGGEAYRNQVDGVRARIAEQNRREQGAYTSGRMSEQRVFGEQSEEEQRQIGIDSTYGLAGMKAHLAETSLQNQYRPIAGQAAGIGIMAEAEKARYEQNRAAGEDAIKKSYSAIGDSKERNMGSKEGKAYDAAEREFYRAGGKRAQDKEQDAKLSAMYQNVPFAKDMNSAEGKTYQSLMEKQATDKEAYLTTLKQHQEDAGGLQKELNDRILGGGPQNITAGISAQSFYDPRTEDMSSASGAVADALKEIKTLIESFKNQQPGR